MVTENVVHKLADAQPVTHAAGNDGDFLMDLAADVYTLPCLDFRCLQEGGDRLDAVFALAEHTAVRSLTAAGCTLCCTGSGSFTLSCLQAVCLTVVHLSFHDVLVVD